MKKILALILATLMLLCTFTSCGNGNSQDTDNTDESQKQQENENDVEEETENEEPEEEKPLFTESTAGLKFQLNDDKKGYTLISVGTCTATEIFIEGHQNLPVTFIESEAFKDCNNITKVTVSDTVELIGVCAFENCEKLTDITLGNNINRIGVSAFFNTGYYNNASNWENDVLYIGNYLIKAKETITGTYTAKENTLLISDVAFYECVNLSGIILPKSLKYIGFGAFIDCSSITNITIPDSVKKITGETFESCTSLTSVTMGNGIEELGLGIFSNTPYDNDDSYWENGVLYVGNYLIEAKIDIIPEEYTIKDGTRVIAEYAFYNAETLKKIQIPDSVISICRNAFSSSSLTEIKLSSNVKFIGNEAFSNCEDLKSITVDENNAIYKSIDENLYSKDGSKLINYACGKTATSFEIPAEVSIIENRAFSYAKNLTDITIPNNVTNIGNYAFADASSLKNIVISDKITHIGYRAFAGTKYVDNFYNWDMVPNTSSTLAYVVYLENYLISTNLNLSEITEYTIKDGTTLIADRAFMGCRDLTKITLSDDVKIIGNGAFSSCNNLTNVTLPESIESIGNSAFDGCYNLCSITLPKNLKNIAENAFDECPKLVEIINQSSLDITADYALEIHNGSSKTVTINGFVFYTCNNTNYLVNHIGTDTKIILPENYNGENYVINDYAFFANQTASSLTISNGVSAISNNAFNESMGGHWALIKIDDINFANTEGWQIYENANTQTGTPISSEDISDPQKAAEYLKSTYTNYYWKRG